MCDTAPNLVCRYCGKAVCAEHLADHEAYADRMLAADLRGDFSRQVEG